LRDRDHDQRKKKSKEETLIHSGNRVIAARPKGMTPKDSSGAESNPFDHPISLERFKRIGRARGIVTAAGGEKWRDDQLVAANQPNEYRTHSILRCEMRSPVYHRFYLTRELAEGGRIGCRFGTEKQIYSANNRQHTQADNLAKTTFGAIPVDDVSSMLWHHNADSWRKRKGSRRPSLETLGLHPLPCTS
jgi:hypothetical protein